MVEEKVSPAKNLFNELEQMGFLEYGSVISADLVRRILGIELPDVATKKVFDELTLLELGAIDYIRKILLDNGKYIARENNTYRILLPSENKSIIERYMNMADNKLHRANKLNKSTPKVDTEKQDYQIDARLALKMESARRYTDSLG